MFKQIAAVVLASFFLSSCANSSKILQPIEINRVVKPPKSFDKCPDTRSPAQVLPANYTQRDVGRLLWAYYRANKDCRASLDAVWEYLDSAEETLK